MAATTTLRRILTQQKPSVPCKTKASKNTRGRWPSLGTAGVSLWEDFNLNNLIESYGHVLDLDIPGNGLKTPDPEQKLATLEINKPNDINYLIQWNDDMINPTVGFAKNYLNLHNGVSLRTEVEAPDKSTVARVNTNTHLDHLIMLDEFPRLTLVVGLGRPTSKFHARELAEEPGKTKDERFWPMKQLANLCEISRTRYGYIQTEEDLLACCFSTNGKDDWGVKVMPIPWSRHYESQLTTDLAIWWLCMLAMSSQNRALVRKEEVIPVNHWQLLNNEQGWVRRHAYSKFEKLAASSTPHLHQSPSPDNAAANDNVANDNDAADDFDPLIDFDHSNFFFNNAEVVDINGFNFNTPVDLNTANEEWEHAGNHVAQQLELVWQCRNDRRE